MRHFIITEEQEALIKEMIEEELPFMNNGDMREFGNDEEIGTTAIVSDSDGEAKPGKDVNSDEVAKQRSYQGFWGSPRARI